MKQRSSWLRRLVIWTGPIAGMAVLVVGGFLYWVLGTTPGTRWALVTAAMQLGGTVSGVSGSVWHGLQVDRMSVSAGTTSINLAGLELIVEWPELLQRQLHVRTLSADNLAVAVTSAPEADKDSEPFSMPEIPLQIRVDQFALGTFSLTLDNDPIPVSVQKLATSLYLDAQSAQLRVLGVDIGHELADVHVDADLQLLGLAEPWPFDVFLRADVQARGGRESLLCARHYMPDLPDPSLAAMPGDIATASEESVASSPNDVQAEIVNNHVKDDAGAGTGKTLQAEPCAVALTLGAQGDIADLTLTTQAEGQGMALDATLNLAPQGVFPLKDAQVALTLADASSLHASVDWVPQESSSPGAPMRDVVRGALELERLNVGQLAGAVLPAAVLSMSGTFEALIEDRARLVSSMVDLDIAEGSVWNDHPLQGVLRAGMRNGPELGSGVETQSGGASAVPDWRSLVVHDLDIDIALGDNQVQASGGFGLADSSLELDVAAPALAAFWPGLPGGIRLQGQLDGMVRDHGVTLDGVYTPENSAPDMLGQAPAEIRLDARGGWHVVVQADAEDGTPAIEGWEGQIRDLHGVHAGLAVQLDGMPALRVAPGAPGADGLWRVGRADVGLTLDGKPVLQLVHDESSGGSAGQWATAGQIERLEVSPELIESIQSLVKRLPGQEASIDTKSESRGGVRVRGAEHAVTRIALGMNWDLRFDQMLSGTLRLHHLDGDLMVPAQPPFALGLEALTLDVTAQPQGGGYSRLDAALAVITAEMGRANVNVTSRMLAAPGGGFSIETAGTTVAIDANIDDLGWVSLFTGDAMEFGGHLHADVTLVSQADGSWDNQGTVSGTDVRIVRIDDGVRLLDGTLEARLENDRVILERLEFPARLRVEPKEWRTAEWVSTNPDAEGGYLRLSGEWRFSEVAGEVDVELYRYPVLQRADRYAMVTGDLHIDAILPSLSITGRVEADAGWIDLDMLGGIPTVDGDVVVIRAGEEPPELTVPMDISMDIEVDLGPRVYLTGYGVNSGLVGNMRIVMVDNKLTAIGALRTRGGAIEAYGQRLQLRRGSITFQGDIASPILNIEALRTGYAVEAGVRVSGTARRPVIDLVSYPDVSELEKLSWLLFGHGPDESGGDMALLLSVGTALLGDGEPFYRKFGIDELTLQSGDIGRAGSILPAESVVSGLSAGSSELERQFIVASKGVATGLTVSIRQALADAGTVGRVSYRLARGLTAELSLGTVNGLALVYRWFSRD